MVGLITKECVAGILLYAASSRGWPEPLARVFPTCDSSVLNKIMYRVWGTRIVCEQGDQLPLRIWMFRPSPGWWVR